MTPQVSAQTRGTARRRTDPSLSDAARRRTQSEGRRLLQLTELKHSSCNGHQGDRCVAMLLIFLHGIKIGGPPKKTASAPMRDDVE
jgi:hypothetical protein